MDAILSIDQGTHASRALLFDQYGRILQSSERPVSIVRGQNGVVEQDALEILDSVREVIDEVATKAGKSITVAALATQRSTLVAWDRRTGDPLARAISWQDRRCCIELEDLKKYESRIQEITGLPLSPHYLAGKIRCLLNNNESVIKALYEGDLMMGSLSSFLCFHLLEGKPFTIDHSNASRSLLFDIARREWSMELLDLFEVPLELLPECVPTLHDYGVLKDYGIPLSCVCGDQNAAMYANGQPAAENITINLGTGAFVLQYQSREFIKNDGMPASSNCLLTGIATSTSFQTDYLVEGTVNGVGSALSVLQQQCPDQDIEVSLADWLNQINEPELYFNGTGGVGSPWWIAKLENQSKPICGDISEQAVAVIESIVFMLMHNILQLDCTNARSIHISGGLSRLDGLCQKLADLSRFPVIRFEDKEATARGSAWLVANYYEVQKGQAKTVNFKLNANPSRFIPASNITLEQRYEKYTKFLIDAVGTDMNLSIVATHIIGPRIIGHRGYRQLYPENTLESIVAAINAGADCVEFDVQFSGDNIPVIHHDETLERVMGETGFIHDYTLDELREFSVNEETRHGSKFSNITISTLKEITQVMKENRHVHFFIEMKRQTLARLGTPTVMTRVLDIIKDHSEHCTIISFNKEPLEFAKQHSNVSIGWVLRKYNQEHFEYARQLRPDFLLCNHEKLTDVRPVAGPWQWVFHEVNNVALANRLFFAGVNYISTANVQELCEAYRGDNT